MAAYKGNRLKKELIEPAYSSAVGSAVYGEKIGVVLFICPAGSEVKPHARRVEQIQTVIKGKADFCVGGQKKVVGPGDAALIPANTEYSIKVLEELEVVGFEDVRPKEGDKREKAEGQVYFRWDEMASDFITPEYSKGKGPIVRGESLEVAYMKYPPTPEGKTHSHPNEQIQVALTGKMRGRLGGEIYMLEEYGDFVVKPSYMEQSGGAIEDYTALNCKDIVPGWSVYHARWEK
jgi:quercetin dioxygenase-like cupin family protein